MHQNGMAKGELIYKALIMHAPVQRKGCFQQRPVVAIHLCCP